MLVATIAAAILLVAAFPGRQAAEAPNVDWGKRLTEAANQAGVAVQTDQMFTMERDGVRFTGGVIDGFETTPATDLPGGIDYAFGYLSVPDAGIQEDFYTFRVSTPGQPRLGDNTGTVELIDRNGNIAHRFESAIEVSSLTVPANPAAPQSVMTGSLDVDAQFQRIFIGIWVRCPNGMWVCVEITIDFHGF
ncbi:MAG: hypothetical protein AAGD38_19180 [Acidobacteriota bacterium]